MLNAYRDEAKEFLRKLNASDEGVAPKLAWLEEELGLLKDAAAAGDADKLRHQVYDLLFILFEIAADSDFDLDAEWDAGRERKRRKYTSASAVG